MRFAVASVIALAAFALAIGGEALAAPKASVVSTPSLQCDGATQAAINIRVCAGATGLPAGFTVQWMTAADYAANLNTWYSSDDPRACDASFSGNANLSRYNLTANQCVSVDVGEFLFDNGTSTDCAAALACGTDYVFRAFGHATNTLTRSAFTGNLPCSTLPCGQETSCTLTQGYWKTHGPIPTGQNTDVWPATPISLGTVAYTDLQLQSIFDTPAAGNGLIALAHQLIAAKLNIANGADPTAVAATVALADATIGGLVVPPVGSGSLTPSATSTLTTALMSYNEGATGPGHCE
jgi:hypothetical protein